MELALLSLASRRKPQESTHVTLRERTTKKSIAGRHGETRTRYCRIKLSNEAAPDVSLLELRNVLQLRPKSVEAKRGRTERGRAQHRQVGAFCHFHRSLNRHLAYLVQPVEALLALTVANHLVRVEVGQQGRHGRAVVVRLVQSRLKKHVTNCVSEQFGLVRMTRLRTRHRPRTRAGHVIGPEPESGYTCNGLSAKRLVSCFAVLSLLQRSWPERILFFCSIFFALLYLDGALDDLVVEQAAVELLDARRGLILLPRQEVLHQQLLNDCENRDQEQHVLSQV